MLLKLNEVSTAKKASLRSVIEKGLFETGLCAEEYLEYILSCVWEIISNDTEYTSLLNKHNMQWSRKSFPEVILFGNNVDIIS
jgi:hypothetical protein